MVEVEGGGGGITSGADSQPLFEGKKFWLSQNVPSRTRFKDLIKRYGGTVVLLEKDADIKLVDHMKKNLPPDTYSYKYVERSIANKKLENLEAHRAGPSAPRPMGATHIPTKSTRSTFTLEEDQFLWDLVQPLEKRGYPVKGLKLYQEIAAKHPRHTLQSWRERYLKKLQGHPRPGGGAPAATAENSASHERRDIVPPRRTSPSGMPEKETRNIEQTVPPAAEQEDRKRKRGLEDERGREDDSPEASTPRGNANAFSRNKRAASSNIMVVPPTLRPHKEVSNRPNPATRPVNSQVNRAAPALPTQEARNIPQEFEEPVVPSQRAREVVRESEEPVDSTLLELPFFPLSPESEEEDSGEESEEVDEQDIDTWIDTRLRTGKAKDEVQVIEALHCTSMDPKLADKVLEHMNAGKGIPDDMPGVWTREDDEGIEGTDARAISHVLAKHGKYINARWEYLSLARAAGLAKRTENS